MCDHNNTTFQSKNTYDVLSVAWFVCRRTLATYTTRWCSMFVISIVGTNGWPVPGQNIYSPYERMTSFSNRWPTFQTDDLLPNRITILRTNYYEFSWAIEKYVCSWLVETEMRFSSGAGTTLHWSPTNPFSIYLNSSRTCYYFFSAGPIRMRSVYLILRSTSITNIISRCSNKPTVRSLIILITEGPSW